MVVCCSKVPILELHNFNDANGKVINKMMCIVVCCSKVFILELHNFKRRTKIEIHVIFK